MKVSREQIERLRDHAGVSYEDAQAALEASGGDQLDALVWLEQAGKIPSSGVHSCTSGAWSEPEPGETGGEAAASPEPEPDGLRVLWKWLVDNRLEAYRRDNRFVGPHLGRSQTVQDVMEKIDDGAESVVDQVWRNIRPRR